MKSNHFTEITDSHWYLPAHPLYPGEKFILVWKEFVPPNILPRQQEASLIESAQQLLVALLDQAKSPNERLSPGSVQGTFYRLRRLVRWMVGNGLWQFNQLTGVHLLQYLETISDSKSRPPTDKTILTIHNFLKKLWLLRGTYSNPLQVNPAKLTREVHSRVGRRRDSKWKYLPDDLAIPLISDALAWIEGLAEPVLSSMQYLDDRRHLYVGRNKKARTALHEGIYSLLELEPCVGMLRTALKDDTSSTMELVREAFALTEGACIAVFFFLNGLRAGELGSIDTRDGLELIQHHDGEWVPYLCGIAAKSGGRKRSWIISEPGQKAYELMVELFKTSRESALDAPLFLTYSGNGAFHLPGRRVGRMHTNSFNVGLKRFATSKFRDTTLQPDFQIHTHMGRKTFAAFCVRRDRTALGPLSLYYWHMNELITDGSYVGADFELAALLEQENRIELRECLTQLLNARQLAGRAGNALKAKREEYVASLRFGGKKTLGSVVDDLIEKGTKIAPCNWGYCLYTKSLSACSGNETGPDESNRSPTVCSSCSNFAVTEKHRPWWESRAAEGQTFLTRPEISEQSRVWVLKRLDGAQKILSDLNSARIGNGLFQHD